MSFTADREEVARGARTALLVPDLPHDRGTAGLRRGGDARVAELEGLAVAIGLEIISARTIAVRKVNPATLFGKGQVEATAALVEDERIDLVVVDGALTPIQQRNLETGIKAKVIDRTALILEIFGERATTAEGRLQVELAHLDYQQGRLVRSWTHLERQRGGFGFLGGPGETQIEADRRLIRDRMARLRRSLDDVRRTRGLHRERRQRAPWPVVALVGYTNAGKSTLFNRLSTAEVLAQDMLFATLDPTMRRIAVDGLGKVILSDTVGFVSDLPTQLVAAFRATLEEVQAADLLLHVRDISHPDSDAQRADVLDVLGGLGIGPGADAQRAPEQPDPPVIEIHNKLDLLPAEAREEASQAAAAAGAIALSATTGEGIDRLLQRISAELGGQEIEREVIVPADDGRLGAWLHENSRVLGSSVGADGAGTVFRVRLSGMNNARLSRLLDRPGR